MILSVTFDETIYNEVPHKFEAGTPNIAGAVALGTTVEYLRGIGMDRVAMLIAGVDSIREVVLFPTLRPEVMTHES